MARDRGGIGATVHWAAHGIGAPSEISDLFPLGVESNVCCFANLALASASPLFCEGIISASFDYTVTTLRLFKPHKHWSSRASPYCTFLHGLCRQDLVIIRRIPSYRVRLSYYCSSGFVPPLAVLFVAVPSIPPLGRHIHAPGHGTCAAWSSNQLLRNLNDFAYPEKQWDRVRFSGLDQRAGLRGERALQTPNAGVRDSVSSRP